MNLPFDLGSGAALWMAAVMFVAAFVRGYCGFGLSALIVAGAALVTDPLRVVPVVLMFEVTLTLAQLNGLRGHVDWRRIALLGVAALVAVPLGLAAASTFGVDTLRVAIALFVLAMCGLLLLNLSFAAPPGRLAHLGVGLCSGLANGAGIGGLPVAVFFTAQSIPPAVFRATMIVYLTALDLWTLPNLALAGRITAETFVVLALSLPLLLVGLHLGGRRFLGTTPAAFRRFAILLLAILAVLGLLRSVV